MAGEVELHHPVGRNAIHEHLGVVAVIEGTNVDVVDVEQQPAAGALGHLGDELPLGHFGGLEFDIGRNVFKAERAAQALLYIMHARDDMIEGFARVGKRQKIVQIDAVNPGPA